MLSGPSAARGNDNAAQAVALTALAYLLADDSRMARFVAATGWDGRASGAQVSDLAFLGGILDFVLEDEGLLLGVAEAAGLRPERVAALRRRLPGAAPHD